MVASGAFSSSMDSVKDLIITSLTSWLLVFCNGSGQSKQSQQLPQQRLFLTVLDWLNLANCFLPCWWRTDNVVLSVPLCTLKLLVQALCFCSKTWKCCGGILVVSHKTAWPFLLLYFSVCSYWLSLCLQAQNDLASLAFIPLAFLDTALCWWISFTVLLDGLCFLLNLFFWVFSWLNFF